MKLNIIGTILVLLINSVNSKIISREEEEAEKGQFFRLKDE